MTLFGNNLPKLGSKVVQILKSTFKSTISLALLLAAFIGVQSSMQVMAEATSDQSLATNDKDRSNRFQENNFDKETKAYTPETDPTGITEASKEFSKNVSSSVTSIANSLPSLPSELASCQATNS